MSKQIISYINGVKQFNEILTSNPGLVILKLGATWCGPCKKIAPIVEGFFATSPPNVVCADLDVDECFELYGFLKSKKMVNGIPVMLMYCRGNTTFIPTDSCTGADPVALDQFFRRCGNHLAEVDRVNQTRTNIQTILENDETSVDL